MDRCAYTTDNNHSVMVLTQITVRAVLVRCCAVRAPASGFRVLPRRWLACLAMRVPPSGLRFSILAACLLAALGQP